jgi:transposase
MIHPRRSKEAFAALIDDWAGMLVSDGYGVYQNWVQVRQTCLAHLIRSARGLAARATPDVAACGAWALAELQRLCHMATAPPTGGEWQAWYARLCKLIDQYHDRADEAGRFARRLLRELDSLWVFLAQRGVEPTNNRAERALRCGVLWRKRSLGTASDKGNRWVERMLSLKETCRLQVRSTYPVLVEAVTRFFQIPSDFVVKSQATDIIDLLLQLIRYPNGVHRSCHHRNQGVRCSQHLQSSGLPLNSVECGKF